LAITVSLEMAVPSLIGFGLDSWLGTPPVLLIVGTILGLVVGLLHLIRLASARAVRQKPPSGQGRL
jgi:F0F1-type ATP synthase assembly protein I